MGKAFRWTKERDAELRVHYSEKGARATAEILGIGVSTIYARVLKLGLKEKTVYVDHQKEDYLQHIKRIQEIKSEAAKGTLRGHKVLSIHTDKVVLEIKARDQASYKECFTFNELALMQ